jgi:hypothetical protein
MIDFSKYIPDVQFAQIPIKNLVSDQEYQRNLSMVHVRKMANNFDRDQINAVKVSFRDGLYRIMNGQHTVETIAAVSGSRETPVWCMIYLGLTYEDEARIFANQQEFVKGLSPYEIFMAKIQAGYDDQLMIRDLVESYGLILSSKKAACTVCAITSVEQIYMKYRFHVLDRTLRLLVGTWEGDPLSLSANMLRGVARLIVSYGDLMKDDVFCDRIGKVSAREITRNAKERREGSLGFAETILNVYNKKTNGRLHRTKLYGDNPHYSIVHEIEDMQNEELSSAVPDESDMLIATGLS